MFKRLTVRIRLYFLHLRKRHSVNKLKEYTTLLKNLNNFRFLSSMDLVYCSSKQSEYQTQINKCLKNNELYSKKISRLEQYL